MSENAAGPMENARANADRRFADVLAQSGMPDPRDRYRDWLRTLRTSDEAAFRQALEYFDGELVPALLEPQADPWRLWTGYGMSLARRLHPGAPVAIDETGRARAASADVALEHLVLHLPTSTRQTALAVRLPARLSPAQEATVELLVERA